MGNRVNNKRGQSVFEYFILSIIVVSIALVFMRNQNYIQVYNALNGTDGVFNRAVHSITSVNGGSGGGVGGGGFDGGGFGPGGAWGGGGAGGR